MRMGTQSTHTQQPPPVSSHSTKAQTQAGAKHALWEEPTWAFSGPQINCYVLHEERWTGALLPQLCLMSSSVVAQATLADAHVPPLERRLAEGSLSRLYKHFSSIRAKMLQYFFCTQRWLSFPAPLPRKWTASHASAGESASFNCILGSWYGPLRFAILGTLKSCFLR